jgi:hypothetical protein
MTAVAPSPDSTKRRVAREFSRYRSGRVRHPELDDVSLFVELALEWTPAEFDETAALLLFVVQNPVARDAVVLQWATDLWMGDRLWQSRYGGKDLELDEVVGNLKLGIGARPDPVRLERGISIVERLVSVAGPQHAPAPLFMLTWLRWARRTWAV